MSEHHQPIITMQPSLSVPDNLERVRDHSEPVRLPPSLDGRVFEVDQDHENDPLVRQARSALDKGKAVAQRAVELRAVIMADESETVAKRHMQVREQTYRLTHPAIGEIQQTVEKIQDQIDRLTDHLSGPALPVAATGILQVLEVRSALRSMSPVERNRAINSAIESGEKFTLMAISRTPSYVLGIDALEQKNFLEKWALKYAPEHHARKQALLVALEAVSRGGRLLLSHANAMASTRIATETEKMSARARAAIAAVDA